MSQSDIIRYFIKKGNKPMLLSEIDIPKITLPTLKRNLYKLTKHNEVIITYPPAYLDWKFRKPRYILAERVVKAVKEGR